MPITLTQAQTLKAELTGDPLNRGYAGMTSGQKAADLNISYRARNRTSISGAEIFNAIVPSEYNTLEESNQQADNRKIERVKEVYKLGDQIDISPGTNARTVLLSAFDAQSETRTNLGAVAQESISRATELGLPRLFARDIDKAEAL